MKITIRGHFDVPSDDPDAENYGPRGVIEALMGVGIYDTEVEVSEDDDDDWK